MKFFFLTSILFIGFHLEAQNTTGLISLHAEKYSQGYNLIYPFIQNNVFLINECGEVVHEWPGVQGRVPGVAAYLSPSGNLIKSSSKGNSAGDKIWAGGAGETIEWINWEGETLYSFNLNNENQRLHHDFVEMPNGNVLAIIWDNFSPEISLQNGRRPDLIIENAVWPDAIIEINPALDSIVWEWHAWDHLIQDFDSTKMNFGKVDEHPERININHISASGQADWMHSNAIDYHEDLDIIALSVAHFNEVWFIDHSTTIQQAASGSGGRFGKGGDLIYRWGNPRAYKKGTTQDQKLFFQHDVQWLENGSVAVFNNRPDPEFSNIVTFKPELAPDSTQFLRDSKGIFLPSAPEKLLYHPDNRLKLRSSGLSSVQLLPNNNWLIFSGNQGYAFEMDAAENKLVWEYIIPYRNGFPIEQGKTASNNFAFKLKRYPLNYSAFQNKNLEPKKYLEIKPNLEFCGALDIKDEYPSAFRLYPNPAINEIYIDRKSNEQVSAEIYSISGILYDRIILEQGINVVPLQNLPSGLYYLAVEGRFHLFSVNSH